MRIRPSKAFALGLALVFALLARAEPPAIVLQEISYLIRYIGDSGCAFKRNGAWSDAKAAEAHVRGKYEFLAKLGQIDTTMDFIDKAATKSSLSGKPYEIRCGGDSPVPSSPWLSNALPRYQSLQQRRQ